MTVPVAMPRTAKRLATPLRTFSMSIRSVDSLNVCDRRGLRPNAFQIRPTLNPLSPDFMAIEALDQGAASLGVDSRVSVRTLSTCSPVTFRGAPGGARRPARPAGRRRTESATCPP
jgi:hypothetical protein